jgi:hypothetical protein
MTSCLAVPCVQLSASLTLARTIPSQTPTSRPLTYSRPVVIKSLMAFWIYFLTRPVAKSLSIWHNADNFSLSEKTMWTVALIIITISESSYIKENALTVRLSPSRTTSARPKSLSLGMPLFFLKSKTVSRISGRCKHQMLCTARSATTQPPTIFVKSRYTRTQPLGSW